MDSPSTQNNVKNASSVLRFPFVWRIQHALMALGVIGLALSGLAYRYYDTGPGRLLMSFEGGFGARGILHRICAALLGAAIVWHFFWVVFTRRGHDDFLALMPEKGDTRRWWEALKTKLRGEPYRADWGRYTLGQKAQYWIIATGSILMALSGLMLLLGDRILGMMPKQALDLIRVIHGGEGVELMIFIVLWHLYSTHLSPGRFPMDNAWLTGRISRERQSREHPREVVP
ncbi:MAG: cytochrome b/b6 domain-containing protein [Calditrichaeota bacterium]|nr:cytochrome b/b6 domain-containing protein [Calditrichota bacterium]